MLKGLFAASLLACGSGPMLAFAAQQPAIATKQSESILKPADLASLMPSQVFFRGQSATVQVRNSAGVRYSDGMLTMVALVDTSGYSSGLQQRYQAYLITEIPLQIGEGASAATLAPGAYGVGFIQNDRFIAMDLGAHELANVASTHDSDLRRATPLQVLSGSKPGVYRLYGGRAYVTFRRAQ